MSSTASPNPVAPVGHQGARVDITATTGAGRQRLVRGHPPRDLRLRDEGAARRPRRVAVGAAAGVRAGGHLAGDHSARSDVGGPVLRHLCRHRASTWLLVGVAADADVAGSASGFATSRRTGSRSTTPTATRSTSRRSSSGRLPTPRARRTPWTTTRTSSPCRPSRRCGTWRPRIPTTTRRAARSHCADRSTSWPPSWRTRWPSASRSPASRSSRSGSRTWPTPRRSPRRCCAGSRRTPSWRPGARIVEGAVGMVELALNRLAANDVVELDEERKASMVSNLLVVLCGDQPPTPVVNAGSLYT